MAPIRRPPVSLLLSSLTLTNVSSDAFYTSLCNVLDLATSTFPVTFSDKELDVKPPPHTFRNREDEAIYHLCMSSPPFFCFFSGVLNRLLQTMLSCSMASPLACSSWVVRKKKRVLLG